MRNGRDLEPLLPKPRRELRPRVRPKCVAGDKAYSSGTVRRYLRCRGIERPPSQGERAAERAL